MNRRDCDYFPRGELDDTIGTDGCGEPQEGGRRMTDRITGIQARCEPMEHELKCWPEYYDAVECGDKPFEIRKWDRPYRVGDTLLLRRWDPSMQDYTGQQMRRKITYLLDLTYLPDDNVPHFAGMVAIGLDDPQFAATQELLDAGHSRAGNAATGIQRGPAQGVGGGGRLGVCNEAFERTRNLPVMC